MLILFLTLMTLNYLFYFQIFFCNSLAYLNFIFIIFANIQEALAIFLL